MGGLICRLLSYSTIDAYCGTDAFLDPTLEILSAASLRAIDGFPHEDLLCAIRLILIVFGVKCE